jgi:hypothetical protein
MFSILQDKCLNITPVSGGYHINIAWSIIQISIKMCRLSTPLQFKLLLVKDRTAAPLSHNAKPHHIISLFDFQTPKMSYRSTK